MKSLKKFDQLIMKLSINWKNTISIKWNSIKWSFAERSTIIISTIHFDLVPLDFGLRLTQGQSGIVWTYQLFGGLLSPQPWVWSIFGSNKSCWKSKIMTQPRVSVSAMVEEIISLKVCNNDCSKIWKIWPTGYRVREPPKSWQVHII